MKRRGQLAEPAQKLRAVPTVYFCECVIHSVIIHEAPREVQEPSSGLLVILVTDLGGSGRVLDSLAKGPLDFVCPFPGFVFVANPLPENAFLNFDNPG